MTVMQNIKVSILDGFDNLSMSLIMPYLKDEFKLKDYEVEALVSIYFFGIVVGSGFLGFYSDKFGRKKSLIASGII